MTITYQDLQRKRAGVIRDREALRQRLISFAGRLKIQLVESLELEHPQWVDPASGERVDYVRVGVVNSGESTFVSLYDLALDQRGELAFFVAITVDESPESFPKTIMGIPVSLNMKGDNIHVSLGERGDYKTSLAHYCSDLDVRAVCEVMKQLLVKGLEKGI